MEILRKNKSIKRKTAHLEVARAYLIVNDEEEQILIKGRNQNILLCNASNEKTLMIFGFSQEDVFVVGKIDNFDITNLDFRND